MSSHQLTEVEQTCDRVTIVDRGRIVASGSPDELAGSRERIEVGLAPGDVAAAGEALRAAGFRVSGPGPANELWVEGAPDGSAVSRVLGAAGVYPDQLIRQRDSLEAVYLRATGAAGEPPA